MKAILVIDMHENCSECLCEQNGICLAKNNAVESIDRPSWCPLKPMPEFKWHEEGKENECEEWYKNGWNACLEELEK